MSRISSTAPAQAKMIVRMLAMAWNNSNEIWADIQLRQWTNNTVRLSSV
jgi:hypothetical protein